MAEHLTPAGRASIIVPEGIIFQSQTAYKDQKSAASAESGAAIICGLTSLGHPTIPKRAEANRTQEGGCRAARRSHARRGRFILSS
jgi:hypothetical protein